MCDVAIVNGTHIHKHIYKEINKINERNDEIEEDKRNAGEKEVRSDGNDE